MNEDTNREMNEGRADRNKRLKREALLSSAYELFTQKGFAETTISDITEHAGIAKGTFYLYYEDKESIRDHLIRIKSEEALHRAYLAMLEEGNGVRLTNVEEAIVFFAENILVQLTEDKELLGFVCRNLAWGLVRPNVGSVGPFSPDTDMSFLEVLSDLFQRSSVQYRDPEVMLYMIVELCGATCYSSIMESEPLPIEEFKPHLLEAIRGIMHSQEIS